jgi:hypothetical protein
MSTSVATRMTNRAHLLKRHYEVPMRRVKMAIVILLTIIQSSAALMEGIVIASSIPTALQCPLSLEMAFAMVPTIHSSAASTEVIDSM